MPGIQFERSDGDYPVLKYDGFTFPPALKVQLTPTPIYSPSGRTLVRIEMTVSVRCVISSVDFISSSVAYTAANASELSTWVGTKKSLGLSSAISTAHPELDPALQYLIAKLSTPGKDLEISGYGFGTYKIQNIDGEEREDGYVPDISNGPFPEFSSMENFTGATCVLATWKVRFSIHPELLVRESFVGSKDIPIPLACDFSINTQILANGCFVRTIDGIVEIVNFIDRSSGEESCRVDTATTSGIINKLSRSFPLLPTCTREINYSLSQDRKQLSFSFTDTQIPSDYAYYPGCASMDVQISANSQTKFSSADLNTYQGSHPEQLVLQSLISIHGTIEVLKSHPKATAYNAFITICSHFFATNPAVTKRGYIVQNFGLTDSLYSRTVSFFINYMVTLPLDELLKETLIFKADDPKAVKAGWDTWNKEREKDNSEYGFEGVANLKTGDRDETVITPPAVFPEPITQGGTDSNGTPS